MRTRKSLRGRRGEEGLALVLALFGLVTLLLVAASGLLVGSSDLRATRNYRGATQVHFVAESAVSEALQKIDGPGVINFQNDVVSRWSNLWGNSPHGFAPLAGFTYDVTPTASGTDPANAGRLLAFAAGPEGVRNTVIANVRRSNIPSTAPGAIYLATDQNTDSTFNGNAFAIDGNDHNYTGGMGPAAPIPGISARNDRNTQETISSLANAQKDNVQGLGYSAGPPIAPSVKTSPAAPTMDQMNQLIADLLARPRPPDDPSTQITGNHTYGTPAAPQITHLTAAGGVTIKGAGNVSGAGILIVESNLTIQGNLNFKGLVIVRGQTETTATGNATLYGSLWTDSVDLTIGGSAIVYYSSQALTLANNVSGGSALPSPLVVTSLADCSQLPSGTGGCP